MRPFLLIALLALPGCRASAPPAAEQDEAETVDRLGLAALLIKDGHFDRAGAVLAEVEPAAPGLDRPRFHTLRGLVALRAQAHADARAAFEAAAAAGPVEPIVHIYLAQACHGAGDPAAALAALARAPGAWEPMAGVHRLVVLARWRTGDRAGAFAALEAAERRFPADADFTRQRLLFLLELGLHQEAAAAGEQYLERAGRTAKAHVALGEALRRSKRPDDAAAVLEAGRARFAGDVPVLVALAHAHLDARRPRAAATVLEEAAALEPRYLAEAAELRRRAGDLDRALRLNARLGDAKEKTRQRLGLLLQLAAFDLAAALQPRLSRLGLLEDEEVRYALAYACFRAGDPERADQHLRGITRPALFAQAIELRKAIEADRLREPAPRARGTEK